MSELSTSHIDRIVELERERDKLKAQLEITKTTLGRDALVGDIRSLRGKLDAERKLTRELTRERDDALSAAAQSISEVQAQLDDMHQKYEEALTDIAGALTHLVAERKAHAETRTALKDARKVLPVLITQLREHLPSWILWIEAETVQLKDAEPYDAALNAAKTMLAALTPLNYGANPRPHTKKSPPARDNGK